MGTNATVKFYSNRDTERKHPILNVYFQFDGYIQGGVGHELAEFLQGKQIINGISRQTMEEGFANGMACLAAQYVKHVKVRIGNVYLTSADDTEYFDYTVYYDNENKQIIIKVLDFEGTAEELLKYNPD